MGARSCASSSGSVEQGRSSAMRKDAMYIGQPLPRVEDDRLLTGRGRFTDDETQPGQAWCAFVRSPHAHARIAAVNTSSVRAAPGVLAVLTGADYEADGLKPIDHAQHPID